MQLRVRDQIRGDPRAQLGHDALRDPEVVLEIVAILGGVELEQAGGGGRDRVAGMRSSAHEVHEARGARLRDAPARLSGRA